MATSIFIAVFIAIDVVALCVLWALNPVRKRQAAAFKARRDSGMGRSGGSPDSGNLKRLVVAPAVAMACVAALVFVTAIVAIPISKAVARKPAPVHEEWKEEHFTVYPMNPFPTKPPKDPRLLDVVVAEKTEPPAAAFLPMSSTDREALRQSGKDTYFQELEIGPRYKFVVGKASSPGVDDPISVYPAGTTPSLFPIPQSPNAPQGPNASRGTLRSLAQGPTIFVQVNEPFCAVTGVDIADPENVPSGNPAYGLKVSVWGIKEPNLCGRRLERGWVAIPLPPSRLRAAWSYNPTFQMTRYPDGSIDGDIYFPTIFRRKEPFYKSSKGYENEDELVAKWAMFP